MRSLAFIVAPALLAAGASADCVPTVVTQWNFNGPSGSKVPGGASNPEPSTGMGSAALFGGTTGAITSGIVGGGSSDPETTVPPNHAWNVTTFPAQGTGDLTRGIELFVSTAGFESITVSWDQRNSNTGCRWVQFHYTLDGVNFTSDGLENGGLFDINAGTTWFNGLVADLSAIEGTGDNPAFGFRMLATFGPSGQYEPSSPTSSYGTTGTWRFDMITITGLPIDECGKEPVCPGDVNDDGIVDGSDLAILLGSWGPCEGCAADITGNGVVDGGDLAILLGAWGPCE